MILTVFVSTLLFIAAFALGFLIYFEVQKQLTTQTITIEEATK